jgi:uncharacterized protein (DUF2147 family)
MSKTLPLQQFFHSLLMTAALSLGYAGAAHASSPDDARGLWLTAQKDAVIEFGACPDRPGALCGRIVWDKDAGTPADTCGVQIVQLNRFDKDAWRDGWVYDPRDKKTYKGIVRAKDGMLKIRAFIGVEMLGETEQLTRTDSLPGTPVCKK